MSNAEILPPETNALSVITPQTAVQFFGEKGLDPIIEKIKAEVAAFKPDMTTEAGRKEIASFAHKIAKMKNRMDDLGKNLVSGIKAQAKIIDAERSRAWDIIEGLQHDVRKPLTEWEEKDKARIALHKSSLDAISGALILPIDVSLAEIESRLEGLKIYDGRDFEEFSDLAAQTIVSVHSQLTLKYTQMKKAAEDRIELERLQKAEADRLQKEREEKIAADAAAKAKKDAEDKAEADRIAAAKKAQDDLDAEAARTKAEADRAEQAEANRIAAERKAEDDKKAAAEKAEREKNEAVEAEKKRAADQKKKEDDEAAKREANKKHCAKINNEAMAVIVKEMDGNNESFETMAKAIITAIAKGLVPHVKITY